MATCDFVPDPCPSQSIAECVMTRECEITIVGPESLAPGGLIEVNLDAMLEINAELNAFQACAVAALQAAFAAAGFPFPSIPDPPEPPDFSGCLEKLDELKNEAQTQLGYLEPSFNIEFNEAGFPVRIQS